MWCTLGWCSIFIGLAGTAFNKDVQKLINVGESLKIGPYTLTLQSGGYQGRAELYGAADDY